MLSPELILELIYWAPLVALLVTSLGLVALKRVSGLPVWLQRVVTPRFYLVALPLATLLVGMEMLAWNVRTIHRITTFFGGPEAILYFAYDLRDTFPDHPVGTLLLVNSFMAPFVVLIISGYMLWRVLGRRGEPERSRGLRALLAGLVFAWVFLTIRYEILFVAHGPFWHLRIF